MTTDNAASSSGGLVLDLDAKRTARREGRGDAIEVRNKGVVFRLPPELPADAIEPLSALAELPEDAEENADALGTIRVSLEQGLAGLFCTEEKVPCDDATGYPQHLPAGHTTDCQWPLFLDTRPSLDDELELWAGLFGAYGVSLGEALASLESSASDGTQSKPTSGATAARSTRATSGAGNRATRRATAKKTPARKQQGGGTGPR